MTDQNDSTEAPEEVVLFGEKEARWFQVAALHAVEQALENGLRRILVEHPTGAGKTITSGLIFSSERVRRALGVMNGRPLRLLFIAHKHRLLTQAERTYADASNVHFIPQSAFSEIPEGTEWDVALLDEAHHEAMVTIQYRLETLGNKPIIGLTATPDRADGCLIKFEEIVNPISREQAVEEGYLAPTYLNSILDAADTNKLPVTQMILDEYGHQFGQTMMFFRTKKEVRAMTAWLQRKGYKAIAILEQHDTEVDQVLDDFSNGHFQFVLNCNKINEGVDVKGCTDVFLGRNFGSYPQLSQVIGRAARPDSICQVWELINPLSGRNLDTTVVVGTPEQHRLLSRKGGKWTEQEFDYVGHRSEIVGKT